MCTTAVHHPSTSQVDELYKYPSARTPSGFYKQTYLLIPIVGGHVGIYFSPLSHPQLVIADERLKFSGAFLVPESLCFLSSLCLLLCLFICFLENALESLFLFCFVLLFSLIARFLLFERNYVRSRFSIMCFLRLRS